MYSGKANWDEIRALKEALDIPVIGNGDIRTGEDAAKMRKLTGCDGIMIARGSHGDPWLFRQARAALSGKAIPSDPGVEERFRICLEHAHNAVIYGEDADRGVLEFRKHLGWYMKGLPSSRELRQDLFQATSLDQIRSRLERYRERHLAGKPFELEPEASAVVS
jgi:tRNA-dihydrouridine synthase